MIQRKIRELLRREGPLSGGDIHAALRQDRFELWKECSAGRGMVARSFGRHYMRLDQRLPGYARLSPSILREFLTYTVVGLDSQAEETEAAVRARLARIQEISEFKIRVARTMISGVLASLADSGQTLKPAAFLLAGDIVYGMAHEEPRPERSTGKLVRGSDIDLVVVLDDSASDDFLSRLDRAIHREKYLILADPSLNQEIDYVVKRIGRVREQAAFDTFKRMVACKILNESVLIEGDEGLFLETREILRSGGLDARLAALEGQAAAERAEARSVLFGHSRLEPGGPFSGLFYSADESEEFE